MNEKTTDLLEQYKSGLLQYIAESGEEALSRAYVIGRSAVEQGVDLLEIQRIHGETLVEIVSSESDPATITAKINSAVKFFAESLSPYEMAHRGFQEAIVTLKARAEELVATNTKLKEEVKERRQAEYALRDSEERYRKLVDTARDVIYTVSSDGKITSLNPSFEQITGWLRSEWLGKPFAPLVHPDDLELAILMFRRVLAGESPPIYEARIRSKTGGYLVGEFVTTPQYRGGTIVGVLGIGRDVTARKRAEEKLRQNEELFRVITENATDLIAILDTSGKRLYTSSSYKALMGDTDSLLGSDSFGDVVAEDVERVKRAFQETLESGYGRRAEYRLATRLRGVRHVESQWNVIRNSEGVVDRVVKISRDITERNIANERIREHEKQLAEAQQLAHIGSWIWDVVSNRISWSEEMCRIYGIAPNGFDGQYERYLDFIHPEDREVVRQAVDEARKSGRPFILEHRITRPDGTIRVLEARGEALFDRHGNIARMAGTGQDITERKQAEEAVRNLAKRVVEAEEKERQRIARELHDNICQQLSGTKMKLESLEAAFKNRDSKKLRDLQKTRREIGNMVNEIRRISANLRPTALDDLGVVTALQFLTREFGESSNLKIDLNTNEIPEDLVGKNVGIVLFRIAQEALSNVAKHAHAKTVRVELAKVDHALTMKIQDDGKGFDVEKPRRPKGIGGLGLVNMQERVMLVGGKFNILSAPRRGTTINIEIPLGR
ncbi:MAG TPA: PAS domain S-box protein [Bacteroidota bacterium]